MPEHLSDAELLIMQCFWAHGPLKTDALGTMLAHKGWRPTTLLTFLSRLCKKGMLEVRKQGKQNVYHPLVSQTAYAAGEGKALLDSLYGGSARNFFAAMVQGQALDAATLAELRQWLEEQEAPNDD